MVRQRGSSKGLTKSQAQAALRRMVEAESMRRSPTIHERPRTVDEVAELLRDRLAVEGARLSYRQNCESMQRIHVSPALGKRRIDEVSRHDVERLAQSMLRRGLAPKTVRNVIAFLHAVFELAIGHEWAVADPVPRAARPLRRRGDSTADLHFLTMQQLEQAPRPAHRSESARASRSDGRGR
jgi:site-specific recombinase XerD